jgi:hypothetical protein
VPSLLELQRSFAAALADARHAPATVPLFRDAPALALERLAVYRNSVHSNCANALTNAYPIVRKIVGGEFFEAMAREYARAHPSQGGDLNAYGERLTDFVAAFPHTQDLSYLPDVARMEWLAHRAYCAADAGALDLARLAQVSEDGHAALRPVLAPACALLASSWPVRRIWEVHQDGYAGPIEVALGSGPDRVLIHRPRWRVQVQSLSRGDYRFLASASAGEALGAALEVALAEDPAFESALALARWVAAGAIVDLSPGPETRAARSLC